MTLIHSAFVILDLYRYFRIFVILFLMQAIFYVNNKKVSSQNINCCLAPFCHQLQIACDVSISYREHFRLITCWSTFVSVFGLEIFFCGERGKNQQDGFAIMTSHEPTVHSSYAGILGVSSSSHPSIGYAKVPKV